MMMTTNFRGRVETIIFQNLLMYDTLGQRHLDEEFCDY